MASLAVDPRVCAKVPSMPRQPEGASLVAPASAEETAALDLFLGWVASLLDVGGELEARAATARAAVCPKTAPPRQSS